MYKKIILSAVVALFSLAAAADNGFTLVTRGAETIVWAIGISPDGHYMSCWLGTDDGSALYDTRTGDFYIYSGESEFCAVTNEGMMLGYGAGCFGYNPITGEKLSGGMSAKGATTDGSIIVGGTSYYKDGRTHSLPRPSQKDLGFEFQGVTALDISDDGSLIVGYVEDWYLGQGAILWHLNDDGDYEVDPVCRDYHEGSFSGDKPYLNDGPTAMSHNGRYIAINFTDNDGAWGGTPYVGRYDMETGVLEKSTISTSCSATRIANDGTMLVHTGDADSQNRHAMIWLPGEENPVYMKNLYPDVPEFAAYDEDDWNYGTCISSDGRYICGMAWPYIEGDDEYYARRVSWLFDREAYNVETGIHEATAAGTIFDSSVAEYYSLDGKKLAAPQKGINIIRQGGKVSKAIVR